MQAKMINNAVMLLHINTYLSRTRNINSFSNKTPLAPFKKRCYVISDFFEISLANLRVVFCHNSLSFLSFSVKIFTFIRVDRTRCSWEIENKEGKKILHMGGRESMGR